MKNQKLIKSLALIQDTLNKLKSSNLEVLKKSKSELKKAMLSGNKQDSIILNFINDFINVFENVNKKDIKQYHVDAFKKQIEQITEFYQSKIITNKMYEELKLELLTQLEKFSELTQIKGGGEYFSKGNKLEPESFEKRKK
ncbi:MAG: hypothetical protein U0T83_00735 [Bacteriovoracaceae bacterium]